MELEGQLVPFAVPNQMMTGSQLRQETEEFERLRKLNKIALANGSTLNTTATQYDKGVYTSEMKKAAAVSQTKEEIERRIVEIERSVRRREERDWQPT